MKMELLNFRETIKNFYLRDSDQCISVNIPFIYLTNIILTIGGFSFYQNHLKMLISTYIEDIFLTKNSKYVFQSRTEVLK